MEKYDQESKAIFKELEMLYGLGLKDDEIQYLLTVKQRAKTKSSGRFSEEE